MTFFGILLSRERQDDQTLQKPRKRAQAKHQGKTGKAWPPAFGTWVTVETGEFERTQTEVGSQRHHCHVSRRLERGKTCAKEMNRVSASSPLLGEEEEGNI